MNVENCYTRIHGRMKEYREAGHRAQDLVDQFICVAVRLSKWKKVGFEGKINGDLVKTLNATSVIRFDELPTLESIFRAKQAWQDAKTNLRGAIQGLTSEQRERFLQKRPNLRKSLSL